MSLAELDEIDLEVFVERLSKEPYDRSRISRSTGVSGESVDQCSLTIEIDGQDRLHYRFSKIESQSLDLANRLVIADELLAEARARDSGAGFPRGYVPRSGDILLSRDGARFRVERYTADGRGVEISGIDSPLLIYIEAGAVTSEFVSLEERRGAGR
jgi:hypothetical protein